ncbi:hypothetical protein [Xylanimonas cellulosilytica]|nr:hypothetical protein [Xylanimonas cellulosilytica]
MSRDVAHTTARSFVSRAYPSIRNDDHTWSSPEVVTYASVEHRVNALRVHVSVGEAATLVLPADEAAALCDHIRAALDDLAAHATPTGSDRTRAATQAA